MSIWERSDALLAATARWVGESPSRFVAVFIGGTLAVMVLVAVPIVVFADGHSCPNGLAEASYTEMVGKTPVTRYFCTEIPR